MEKTFNPSEIEHSLYQSWEEQGYFSPTGEGDGYSIAIPPPNVTGSLHMGHAFQQTIMDTLIRYQRMQGKNTLWQTGTDHAGIATQMVVERKIAAEEEKTRHDYGRDAFIDKIWEWKDESGGTIGKQMRRLGNSIDWSRERFTMDDGMSEAVQEVFVRLFEDDLIYRGKRLVNWDPKFHTAISDLEVENKDKKGHMWHLRYPLANGAKTAEGHDYLVVATTRPETMLGDTGVAVNPEDPRYKDLIGKQVLLPLVNRLIPIVGDDHADMEKGTGCVKITPAHDFNDNEVGKRHNLPLINILDKDAAILASAEVYQNNGEPSDDYSTELPSEFAGLDRFVARKAIVAKFDELGLLVEVKEHDLVAPYGDRSGVIIEPLLTDQWYVRAAPLAGPAVEAVENGEIEFVPKQYENMYNAWMRDIQDWCISRQLWWGQQIPAYYYEGNKFVVAETKEDLLFSFKNKNKNLDFEKIKEYSRIPIYTDSIDDIEGMIISKEFFHEYILNDIKNKEDLIKPIYKINENIPISKLLDLFLLKKEHLFIVIDTYGQTQGVVSLEDAIETLLGIEIVDELDKNIDMREAAKNKMKLLRNSILMKQRNNY